MKEFVLEVSPRLPCPGQRITLSGALPQGAWAQCYIGYAVDWPNGKVPRCIDSQTARLGVVQVDAAQRFHLDATIPEHLPRQGYYAIYVFGAASASAPPVLCNGYEVKIALCGYLDAKGAGSR